MKYKQELIDEVEEAVYGLIHHNKNIKWSAVIPIDLVEQLLKVKGYEMNKDRYETNGYQVDFFCYFEKEGHKNIQYSGDLWYTGSYLGFEE
ncbi:MAG: hypothetical protein GY679_01985 [Mycoplasma sp.]|nr:hypothetical protein [Mycoplasma sp.]